MIVQCEMGYLSRNVESAKIEGCKMATVRDYFDTDFSYALSVHQERTFTIKGGEKVIVVMRLHLDFRANAKYISCFIPAAPCPICEMCRLITNKLEKWGLSLNDTVEVSEGSLEDFKHPSSSLIFTNYLIFYVDGDLEKSDANAIHQYGLERGMFIQLRYRGYAKERAKWEKPMAFICHDSRDKDKIARPLARELAALHTSVWFDEFSLNIGDSLRESIEKGLKECHRCILILTPNFLRNSGWTKKEFNSVFTREIIEGKNVILPIWDEVEVRDIYEYSPMLADKFAANWAEGVKDIARKLVQAVNTTRNYGDAK